MIRDRILSKRWFHVVVLLLGAALFLTGAFHGNIWFDESYSVAIARQSFTDIWNIGSGDVHPVLYYWALHCLYLIFGSADQTFLLAVYRVFTVGGAVCTAALGLTHLRKDFGWRIGLLYTFLAVFTPYISYMSIQIRMYSWATFAVMVAWIYAYRIIRRTLDGQRISVPCWLIFSVSSLAAAYLHYFALLSVFIINVVLIVFLIYRRRGHRRDVVWAVVQALVQVLLYLPWIAALLDQLGVVSSTYWLNFSFPSSIFQIIDYPVLTMQLSFAFKGNYGGGIQAITIALVIVSLLLLACFFLSWLWERQVPRRVTVPAAPQPMATDNPSRRHNAWHRVETRLLPLFKRDNFPATFAVVTYLGLIAVVSLASAFMHSFMVYPRYLFTCIGPLIFFVAWLVCRLDKRSITLALCILLIALSVVNQVLIIHDDYSPANRSAQNYIRENIESWDEPVLGSDIGIMGVTSLEIPYIEEYYLDWQHANWNQAYECYSPTLQSIESWEQILDSYHGKFWVLGTSNNTNQPRDVTDLEAHDDITLIYSTTYFRPYERVYFTVALFSKD